MFKAPAGRTEAIGQQVEYVANKVNSQQRARRMIDTAGSARSVAVLNVQHLLK